MKIIVFFAILISFTITGNNKKIKKDKKVVKLYMSSNAKPVKEGVERILQKRGYIVTAATNDKKDIQDEKLKQHNDDALSDESKVDLGLALATGFILKVVYDDKNNFIKYRMLDIEKETLIKSEFFNLSSPKYNKYKGEVKELIEDITNDFLSERFKLKVNIRANDISTNLTPQSVVLRIDNEIKDSFENELVKGKHTIHLEKEGYNELKKTITLDKDITVKLTLKLSKSEKISRGMIKEESFISLGWDFMFPITELSWGFYSFNDRNNYYLSFKPIFDRFTFSIISQNTKTENFTLHGLSLTSDIIMIDSEEGLYFIIAPSLSYSFKFGKLKEHFIYDISTDLSIRGGFGTEYLYSLVFGTYLEWNYLEKKSS